MSAELVGFYPFELKILQLDFGRVEKHLVVGKAGAALRCWLTVDSLVLSGMVVVVPSVAQRCCDFYKCSHILKCCSYCLYPFKQ